MNRLKLLLALFVFTGFSALMAQTVAIKGTVTSAEDGLPIPSAAVTVKGTTVGTLTGIDGKYSIMVPAGAQNITIQFVGMKTVTETISGRTTIDVVMVTDMLGLDEVVVTALGITRDKKALGYAVQEVHGDNISKTKESNFVNSLSGKIAGVQIKQSNTMGGSADVLIRGYKSLMNNNQALFVVDGVPMDNSITNTVTQIGGNGGYDYGNAAADINPDDIESMSVLKGAAATALYGSRAANGVIMITTKKGSIRKGIGVTFNIGLMFSKIDKATLPKIQKEYGAGYGDYFDYEDIDGDGTDETLVPYYDDASWGHKFDPTLMVVDWVGLEPTDTENYLREVPWVAGAHDLGDFFETGVKQTYNIAFDGGNENGTYRFSYTNLGEKGIMPNSKMQKNTFNFGGSYNLTSKLTVESNATYINDNNKGRYGTGYDPGNPMQSLGQWFQTNVDIYDLRDYWETSAGKQRTWNYNAFDDLEVPIYHNNIYWTRYKNYQNDGRDRMFGYGTLRYKLTSWMTLEGRAATDNYSEFQEERVAWYSNQTSLYNKFLRNFNETNLDIMAKFTKSFEIFSLNGLVGANSRRTTIKSVNGSTIGGLLVPDLYNLYNSVSPVQTTESELLSGVNSIFANVSLGYKNMLYLDLTGRNDVSSTLPVGNNNYFYPSVSTSFIVSELPGIKGSNAFSFLKVRLNYAEVGSDAPVYSLQSSFVQEANWGSIGSFRVSTIINNPELRPERTKSLEAGLEAKLFQNRFGFDISMYKTNSIDQIMPVSISPATGYAQRYVNSGEIENKGIELALNANVIRSKDFTWDIQVNWFKNKNTVLSLYEGVDNILLNASWDISTNITVGQPYGVLRGTDFVYTDGKRTVDEDGYYLFSENSDEIIGNIQPDWNAGITTVLAYKGFTFSGLVDISKGGDLYSTDLKYGLATGLFAETAGLNDKGNPIRDYVEDGGGMIYSDAVYADGTPNTTYIDAYDWFSGWLYDYLPTAYHVYDASYVKLRELAFGYNLPAKLLAKTPVSRVNISIVGRNLWIIYKNLPYYDPEASLSAGNIQGIADGAYPSTRTLGFNLSIGF